MTDGNPLIGALERQEFGEVYQSLPLLGHGAIFALDADEQYEYFVRWWTWDSYLVKRLVLDKENTKFSSAEKFSLALLCSVVVSLVHACVETPYVAASAQRLVEKIGDGTKIWRSELRADDGFAGARHLLAQTTGALMVKPERLGAMEVAFREIFTDELLKIWRGGTVENGLVARALDKYLSLPAERQLF